MSKCSVCNMASSGQTRNKIACVDCNSVCHATCVDMNKEDIEYIVTNKQAWRCPSCAQLRRKSISDDSLVKSDSGDLAQIITMLQEAKDDRKRMESEMNKAFEFVNGKIDDQKAALDDQNKKLAEYLKIIDELRKENVNLKKIVSELEARVVESEQYTRSNTIEIQGIPEKHQEDVYDTVIKVGAALNQTISRESIDVCHRLNKRQGSDQPAGIIVKFLRREDKLKLLERRRVKRNFSTQDLGFSQTNAPVYLNESLCPAKKRLFNAARTIKKDKQYTYLWVRNGKIFMRKQQGDPVISITSMDCLDNLR